MLLTLPIQSEQNLNLKSQPSISESLKAYSSIRTKLMIFCNPQPVDVSYSVTAVDWVLDLGVFSSTGCKPESLCDSVSSSVCPLIICFRTITQTNRNGFQSNSEHMANILDESDKEGNAAEVRQLAPDLFRFLAP